MRRLRFAFDIGTNSIGFAVWRIGPDPQGVFGPDAPLELIWSGVRLFKDGRNPKDGESLAVMRRVPKQARKRRDRFLLRRADLRTALIDAGLFPHDETARNELERIDPYQLRAKGLDEALPPHHFGRALFHLNQRRGFRSNRKTDKADKDKGKIAAASLELQDALKKLNCRTYGEFLWIRHRGAHHDPSRPRDPGRQPTRIRLEGQGAKALYAFYPTRAMIEHEFDELWSAQTRLAPDSLDDDSRRRIRGIIFRQRALKAPKVGKCTFEHSENRIAKALPSVVAREIYERLNHLRIGANRIEDRALTKSERDMLASVLLSGKNISFVTIRKALKIGSGASINFEQAGGEDFKGSLTAKLLSKQDYFGKSWLALSFAQQDAFVHKLLDEADEEHLVARLIDEDGLSEAAARNCASIPLADGYSRLGATANAAILDVLKTEADEKGFVLPYSEAVRRAGIKLGRNWHHSDERDGEIFARLPYYGEVLQRRVLPGSMDDKDEKDEAAYWGRIMNPSVHIGLNQLRRVVNALIEAFGPPEQIVVELARDLKLNRKQKDEEKRKNRDNRTANLRRVKALEELGQEVRRENIQRLRLFEEQGRFNNGVVLCPYSGEVISPSRLFSAEVEIDHILPISRTLDDTRGNQVLALREMNRRKRRKTPFEAFGHEPQWPDILARAQALPNGQRWRFKPDAVESFEKDANFIARQLNETKYMSRLAKAYLGKICDPDQVYVTPGKLVGLLRGKWGLNDLLPDHNRTPDENGRKDRTDHRHHAIDAIVIGALTRGLIQYIATQAGRAEDQDLERVFDLIPHPFTEFRDAVKSAREKIVVSNKPEHGAGGALHEDTAYGFIKNPEEAKEIGNLVYRKPVKDLTEGEIDRVRDRALREQLRNAVKDLIDAKGKARDAKAFQAVLAEFSDVHRIRRVRLGKFEASAVAIRDRKSGALYKALTPGENHHVDIVQLRDESWQGFAASVFDVNQKGWRPQWERDKLGGKLVMRLHKGDAVEIDDDDGKRRVKTVVRIEISANRIRLAPHQEGGKLQERHADPEDLFRWDLATISKLKERNCVAVRVNEIGSVRRRRSNI